MEGNKLIGNKLIIIGTVIFMGIANAAYTVQIQLDEKKHVNFYNWKVTDSIFGEWENTGSVYDCSNWSPAVEEITVGQSFTQTSNDCKQNQNRTVQDREIDEVTGSVRNKGNVYTESQFVSANNSREAIGTLESWISISPTYTEWTNTGAITGCNNWSPETSTVKSGDPFDQTATDCKQEQTRSRQNHEQETTTKAIRDVGSPVAEYKTITVSSTRKAIGTMETTECLYSGTSPVTEWRYYLTIDPNNGGNRIPKTFITFKGTSLNTSGYMNHISTPIVQGGYRYTQGPSITSQIFQVCRKKI